MGKVATSFLEEDTIGIFIKRNTRCVIPVSNSWLDYAFMSLCDYTTGKKK